MRQLSHLAAVLTVLAVLVPVAAAEEPEPAGDTPLARAEKLVEQSDRYLHHSHLRRGMTGYGLSVFEGAEIERFDVEIISVIRNYTAQHDVILARLSGRGLEHSGIIAGMSGSPVYVRDPSDGREKLIGAVAMGWSAQKDPICGIQPISQMLAVAETREEGDQGDHRVAAGDAGMERREFVSTVLDANKRDFTKLIGERVGARSSEPDDSHPHLRPLATPLAVSDVSPPVLQMLRETLSSTGIMPVQVGGGGASDQPEDVEIQLEPGSVLTIPVISGDLEWFASGTVTDVTDNRVLAFGHSLFASGELELPMGPGTVHAVIPHLLRSFKLAAPMGVTGSLRRDESAAILAEVGRDVSMVPMTVRVRWTDTGRNQTLNYQVSRHRDLTGLMAGALIYESALGRHDVPVHHTVRYTVTADYEHLGRYSATDVSRGWGFSRASSDLVRPLYALEYNPFGEPPKLESLAADLTISSGDSGARILELRLDSNTYRPGDTVTGSVIIEPFRSERVSLPISFELPEDISEGTHLLTACDSEAAAGALQREMPHRFDPRTVEELFEALQRVVELPADRLYLRLPLDRGGLAVRREELPDLPASRGQIVARAEQLDTSGFMLAEVRRIRTDYVLQGSVAAQFNVQRRPAETLLHKQEGAAK